MSLLSAPLLTHKLGVLRESNLLVVNSCGLMTAQIGGGDDA